MTEHTDFKLLDKPCLTRRQLLKTATVAALVTLSPLPALARYNLFDQDVRSLSLYNTHTGETLQRVAYWEKGRYQHDALQEINVLLRDHRADAVSPIDPAVIDQLFALQDTFDCQCPIEIISGYRSPETNANMSRNSHGVAKRSYHMQGMAIDLRIKGVPLKALRKEALAMKRGGVGYYPKSDFVHIDSGPVRSW